MRDRGGLRVVGARDVAPCPVDAVVAPYSAPAGDHLAQALVDAAGRWERDHDARALRRELLRVLGEIDT